MQIIRKKDQFPVGSRWDESRRKMTDMYVIRIEFSKRKLISDRKSDGKSFAIFFFSIYVVAASYSVVNYSVLQ